MNRTSLQSYLCHVKFGEREESVRQAGRQAGKQTVRQTTSQPDRWTGRQTDSQEDIQTDRQTDRQTDTKPLTFLRHHPDGPAVVGAVCERGSGGRQTRAHHRDVDRRACGQSLRAGQHCGGRGRGSVAVIKDSGAGLGVSGGHVDVQDPAVHLSFLPIETGSHFKAVCRRPGLHNYLATETGSHCKDVCRRPGLHNYLPTETGSHFKGVCRRPGLHNYLPTETGSHLKDVSKFRSCVKVEVAVPGFPS